MFIPYVEGGVLPGEQIAPWRVETIVRTNLSDAYNMGMLDEYDDNDEVVAYQWSAILDGRVSDYCSEMDGRIFAKNNPDFRFPPAHYNCRSIIIPILKGEDYELSKMPKIERMEGF
jgi:SPP1 gp7 family putative phage head morphogenesis protein